MTVTADLMSAELISIPTIVIRGGTSKGVYLLESDLPDDRSVWGPYLIDMFGARDLRQIDGIGGAVPTTSKCCIIGPSSRPDADVNYTFAQVGIGEERVYWDFNCGNLTPSVGTFAILSGLVPPQPGLTTVRIYQTNTNMLLSVEVPTDGQGRPLVSGDYRIAGVTGTGPAVMTDFSQTVGASLGGELFPTGNRTDLLTVPGVGEIPVSIVDLANMCVFFRARDVGLTGLEMPAVGPQVVDRYVAVRHAAQDLLGVDRSKTTPWPVSITEPQSYVTYGGGQLDAAEHDLVVRFAGIQPMRDTMHEAYPGTASCCTAVAAVTPGTVVNDVYAGRRHSDELVRIGHPSGAIEIEARTHEQGKDVVVDRAVFGRTVRPILRGEVFVRREEVDRLLQVIPADDPTRSRVPDEVAAPSVARLAAEDVTVE